MRMRETALFIRLVWNLTSPSCSSIPRFPIRRGPKLRVFLDMVQNREGVVRRWPPNEHGLTFGDCYLCATFGENRLRNATVRVRTDRQTDTWQRQNEFIICPMLHAIANGADNQKFRYWQTCVKLRKTAVIGWSQSDMSMWHARLSECSK